MYLKAKIVLRQQIGCGEYFATVGVFVALRWNFIDKVTGIYGREEWRKYRYNVKNDYQNRNACPGQHETEIIFVDVWIGDIEMELLKFFYILAIELVLCGRQFQINCS